MAFTENDVPVRMAKLTICFLFDNLTEAEHAELDDWVTANMHNQRVFEELISGRQIDCNSYIKHTY